MDKGTEELICGSSRTTEVNLFSLYPDHSEDRCTVCGSTENIHRYEGEHYCKNHLNERVARDL